MSCSVLNRKIKIKSKSFTFDVKDMPIKDSNKRKGNVGWNPICIVKHSNHKPIPYLSLISPQNPRNLGRLFNTR